MGPRSLLYTGLPLRLVVRPSVFGSFYFQMVCGGCCCSVADVADDDDDGSSLRLLVGEGCLMLSSSMASCDLVQWANVIQRQVER